MIRLAKPAISEVAIANVADILRSGNLVQGRYVQDFESAIQNYLKVKHAVVVSSGTAALHLSLVALGVDEGDEVIVPAFTFPATANVVELVRAKPVFVDIQLDDFCIDVSRIESAITDRTKAIMPVHEFGQSAEMDAVIEIADRHGLYIIEDAACALGTEYKDQKAGTLGRMGCFSFHPRKAITTGEGGVVVTSNDALADKLRRLRNHGMVAVDGKYDFVDVGFNYRMTDFQAALGLSQLAEIDRLIDARIRMAANYDKKLASIERLKTPAIFPNRKMVYQTYHVLLDDGMNRDDAMRFLETQGVQSNLGAQALHALTYYKNKYDLPDFPNATRAFRQGLALPIGNHLKADDIEIITDLLKSLCYLEE